MTFQHFCNVARFKFLVANPPSLSFTYRKPCSIEIRFQVTAHHLVGCDFCTTNNEINLNCQSFNCTEYIDMVTNPYSDCTAPCTHEHLLFPFASRIRLHRPSRIQTDSMVQHQLQMRCQCLNVIKVIQRVVIVWNWNTHGYGEKEHCRSAPRLEAGHIEIVCWTCCFIVVVLFSRFALQHFFYGIWDLGERVVVWPYRCVAFLIGSLGLTRVLVTHNSLCINYKMIERK